MHAFQYHRPGSTKDALALGKQKSDGKYLAGGQSLVQAMKLRLSSPSDLIDLGTIRDLVGIKASGNAVEIAAMTRHADVAGSADVKRAIPSLAAMANLIGDRQVRHLGTLGGSLANNDPAADYPAAVLALNATVITDRRKIPADQFFKGLYETALNEGEIITAVSFPIPEKAGYQKFKQPASRFALVGVFVAKGPQGVRVAVTGAGASVFRAKPLEDKLAANWSAAACEGVKLPSTGLNSDLHGSAEYRAALIPVLAGRAVAAS